MITRDDVQAAEASGSEALVSLVEALVAENATLRARIKELEERLNKDSHNSHQPPSSDRPGKRRPHTLRMRSGKKRGGQAGHPGVTRYLVDDPDTILPHEPQTCVGCGRCLEAVPALGWERRQVIEVPEPRPVVIEHQGVQKTCPICQTMTTGEFPAGVTQPVQYGPRAKAVMVYLQSYQLLSYERTVEALDDLFGVSPSEGTLASAQQSAYTILAPVEQAIGQALRQAPVAHVDETGIQVAGCLAWVHVMSTAALTVYAHHAKRGRKAFETIGLLIGFGGRRVHDAWAPYLSLTGLYALCNAHLLRELIALFEETEQPWAQHLINLLLSMKVAVADARASGQTTLSTRQRAGYEAAYTRFITAGLRANPPPPQTRKRGRPKHTPAQNLLTRLVTHRGAILAFLHDFQVPFDNNQAERDLRMFKSLP